MAADEELKSTLGVIGSQFQNFKAVKVIGVRKIALSEKGRGGSKPNNSLKGTAFN
ncbi:hypothetical protein CCACVL1_18370 [Corchorus capsularis]|uniref:Uncharacterized protein n=1 Tax=Corchorus capsularis TaxID=210143 RepID=A0A1R3HL97_COCAP|nr:hypothetical protein CCACVL1_18370 [Corchorus capsularis]